MAHRRFLLDMMHASGLVDAQLAGSEVPTVESRDRSFPLIT